MLCWLPRERRFERVSARMTVFRVCASITIADSLLEGKSKFLAEVERLRETVRAADGQRPVLFLIDEILGGTNSRTAGSPQKL